MKILKVQIIRYFRRVKKLLLILLIGLVGNVFAQNKSEEIIGKWVVVYCIEYEADSIVELYEGSVEQSQKYGYTKFYENGIVEHKITFSKTNWAPSRFFWEIKRNKILYSYSNEEVIDEKLKIKFLDSNKFITYYGDKGYSEETHYVRIKE